MSQTSQDRMMRLLEKASQISMVGGWELQLEPLTLTWSPEVYRIHELPLVADPKLDEALNYYSSNSRPVIEAAVHRGIEHHEPWDLELQLLTARGNLKWVRAIGEAEVVDQQCVRLWGTFQDISKQRSSERNLYLTQKAVDQSADAVFFVRQNGSLHYVNQQAALFLAISRERLCQMSITDFSPEIDLDAWGELFQQVKSVGFLTRETQHRRSDQSLYDCELRMSILAYSEEEYIVVTVRDITQSKRDAELRDALFERSTDAHMLFDESGIVSCNHAAVEMLRMDSKEELLNHHPGDFSDALQPARLSAFELVGPPPANEFSHGLHRFDAIHSRKDGDKFPCEVTLNPVQLKSGPAMLTVWHDISERKRAEHQMRESQERLDLALSNANVGLWDRDLRSGETFFSDTYKHQLGYPSFTAWSSAAEWSSRLHPDDREAALARMNDYLHGHNPEYSSTFRLRHYDGSYRWILAQGKAHFDDEGVPQRVVGVHVDVTGRKLAEEERDRFFALSLDLFCVVGFDGYFKNLNRSWELILGYTTQELYDRPCLSFLHPQDRSKTIQAARKLTHGDDVIGFVNRFRHRDGSYRWLEWSVAAAEPCALSLNAVARDITERKNSELKLQQLNDELQSNARQLRLSNAALEKSNVELQQFAYIASHDLQSPLRAIAGFAQILKEDYQGRLDETADEYIERIVAGAGRMRDLIQDLLGYSRVDAKALRFHPTDLHQLVDDVAHALEVSIRESGATVTHESLPTVVADAGQMSQLFLNLIGNAIKYHGPSPPQIRIRSERDSEQAWKITVEDNGIGIARIHHTRIFEIFRRLHAQHTYPGTGIGLAVCRRIVDRHGGRIWVDSQEGNGAQFHFTIPCQQEQP